MYKKISMLLTMIVFLLSAFTVSVYAWFTTSTTGHVGEFSGSVISAEFVDVEKEFEFEFNIPDLDDISYIHNNDLSNPTFDYHSYSATVGITMTNRTDYAVRIGFDIRLASNEIPGQYAGVEDGLLYLPYLPGSYPFFGTNNYANTLANFDMINNQGFMIQPDETITVMLDVWGYYDGLIGHRTFDDLYDLAEVYYSLIYRGTIVIFAL